MSPPFTLASSALQLQSSFTSWICLVWPEAKFLGKVLEFVHQGQKLYTRRFQSANKSPQGQVQPPDSIANADMENNSNIDVGKSPSKNTSDVSFGDTVFAGDETTSSSDQARIWPQIVI